MKSILIALIAVIALQGCATFVPAPIKREVSLIRTDIEVCGDEAKALEAKAEEHRTIANNAVLSGDKTTAIEEFQIADSLSKQAAEKVLRSYKRVTPHVVNTDNYMQHRDSTGNK
jgi:hypothetical protein